MYTDYYNCSEFEGLRIRDMLAHVSILYESPLVSY